MKYKEAAALIEELVAQYPNPKKRNLYLFAVYQKGMEDIVRVLCDKGVIDNSDELEREAKGGY